MKNRTLIIASCSILITGVGCVRPGVMSQSDKSAVVGAESRSGTGSLGSPLSDDKPIAKSTPTLLSTGRSPWLRNRTTDHRGREGALQSLRNIETTISAIDRAVRNHDKVESSRLISQLLNEPYCMSDHYWRVAQMCLREGDKVIACQLMRHGLDKSPFQGTGGIRLFADYAELCLELGQDEGVQFALDNADYVMNAVPKDFEPILLTGSNRIENVANLFAHAASNCMTFPDDDPNGLRCKHYLAKANELAPNCELARFARATHMRSIEERVQAIDILTDLQARAKEASLRDAAGYHLFLLGGPYAGDANKFFPPTGAGIPYRK